MNTDPVATDPGGLDEDDDFSEIELTGQILSERYRLLDRIGEGGMGVIYRAEHVHMRKTLAVKVLHPELTTVDEVVQRFEREAQAAANIDHPNICAATDFGRAETGEFYLVMEYLEGVLLSDLLEEGPLPIKRALLVAQQICAGLARAHEMGIVHRDLKPENVVLIERDGESDHVKVLDFGIARVPVPKDGGDDQTLTRAGFVMGTPAYLSPEQASGGVMDHRADLYSLGVVLFEMIAGRRPFESPSSVELIGMHVTRPAPALARVVNVGKIPRKLDQLVARLLEKEARDRPASASIVRDELINIAEKLDLTLSSDGVALMAKEAASRAAEKFNTMRNRVSPVLREVKDGAPDALPLLKRMPTWIWIAIAANLVVGSLAVVGFWSTLDSFGDGETGAGGTTTDLSGVATTVDPTPPEMPDTKSAAGSALEKLRARPDVAAALAKEKTKGADWVAHQLGAIYRNENSPELAYLLARAESKAGDERPALLHARAALVGNEEWTADSGMRSYVIKGLTGRNSGLAGTILQRHYLPRYASELQDLACSDSRKSGRRRAQAVLSKSKSLGAIEPYCKLIIELERGKRCTDRHATVKAIAALGDRRALSALKNLKGGGGRRGFVRRRRRGPNGCLQEDLEKAISALEKAGGE